MELKSTPAVWPTLLLATTISLVGGCSGDNHDHPELISGQQLFEYHCADCHHAAGNGNFLAGIPANRETRLTTAQIVKFLRDDHRLEGSKMPVWPEMPEDEARKIALYLKSL